MSETLNQIKVARKNQAKTIFGLLESQSNQLNSCLEDMKIEISLLHEANLYDMFLYIWAHHSTEMNLYHVINSK